MADELIIAKFIADISQYQAKLKELEDEVRILSKTEGDAADKQKKSSNELATASQKRKAALQAEEAELKRLQAGLKAAFNPSDIEKFNNSISKTQKNISLLKGETTGVGKVTQGLKSQFAGLGAGIAAAFTVDAVIAFGKASIDSFLEAEENAQRLKNSLREIGADGDVAFERLIKQSEKLAQTGVTIFTDDDIQRAQAQLATFGLTADQIEKLIPKLADYASATKQNIVDASSKVGAALLGQGREFKKYGINVDASKTSLENYNVVIDGFAQFQGRAAKETETLTGQLADQKREVDELQESIGEKLAPAWVKAKAATLGFINSVLNAFSVSGELKKQFKDLGVTATETQAILDATGGDINTSKSGVKAIQQYKSLINAINDFNFALENSKQPQIDYQIALSRLNVLITQQNTQTKEGQYSIALLKNGIAELTENYTRLNPALKSSIDLSKKSTDELIKLKEVSGDDRDLLILIDRELAARKKQQDALKKLADEAEKAAKRIKDAQDAAQKETNRLAGVTQDLNDMIQKDATKMTEDNAKDQKKINDELFKDHKDQVQASTDFELSEEERKEKEKTKILEQEADRRKKINDTLRDEALKLANQTLDAIFEIQERDLKRTQQKQTEALQTEKDKALSNKRLTEAQKEQINKEFAAKERELAKKQFEQSKNFAVSQAVMKGALAVINALATSDDIYVGLILAAGVAATTALEIATIESQKFAKGKREKQKGGPAYVGEQGKEFMYVPDNAMIVDAQKTNRHKALINAMMDNTLDDYLEKSFVIPRLQTHIKKYEERKEKSFSNNVAKALIFHGLTPLQAEKIRKKGIVINNANEIIEGIVKGLSRQNDSRQRI